ncbi:MAG: hypothetical protein L0H96_25120 [Humibacillus sp.]|nr:hypothetical protein [Humibacillus sp.]
MITGTATLRSPNYHRPADTAATLDYPRMARAAIGLANALDGESSD